MDSIEGLSPAISIEQKTTSQEPALDRGHRHRDLRLPARALRAHRRAPLPAVRPGDRRPDRPADGRPGADAAGRARGSSCWRRSCAAARASTGSSSSTSAARASSRVRVNGTAPRARRRDRAGQEQEAHDRGGRGPAGGQGDDRRARLADSLETALRLADGRGAWWRRWTAARRCSSPSSWPAPRCGISLPRGLAADVLLQQPLRRLPACGGLGTRCEIDPELVVPSPRSRSPRGALAPWAGRESAYFQQTLRGPGQAPPVQPRRRRGRSCRRRSGTLILHGERRGRRVRGRARASSSGGTSETTLRGDAAGDRALHVRAAVPRLRGARLRPESARRAGRRALHRRASCALTIKAARPSSSTALSARRARAGHRPPRPEGDPRAARLPHERRARLPDARPGRRPRSPAARGSASAWPPRSARAWSGVLYILDEPSIGLHQRDNRRLLDTLQAAARPRQHRARGRARRGDDPRRRLRRSTSGPGAGELGGHVVAAGRPDEIMAEPGVADRALPGRASCGSRCPTARRRPATGKFLTIHGAREHNLKGMTVRDPARDVHLRHGRVGLRQVHAGQRHPLPRPGPGAPPGAGPARRPRPDRGRCSTSTRSSTSTSRRSAGRPRSNPATYTGVFTLHPHAVRADAGRAGARLPAGPLLASTSRAAAARPARATGWSRSRCTSCPTST